MANYIKPTVKLAALSSGVSGVGSCTTTKDDISIIVDAWQLDINTAFGINESCIDQVPYDMYCKFTSVDNGALKVLYS